MNITDHVTEALKPLRKILFDEYHRQLTEQYNKFEDQLIADGMDARKSFDYPSGFGGTRAAFKLQEARYKYCSSWTQGAKCSIGMWEPNIRVFFPEMTIMTRITESATKMADMALSSYIGKMTLKITEVISDKPVKDITYHGSMNPWSWSTVTVTLDECTIYNWKTKMIINVSCLKKVFNQFPTRLIK